jgi:hypothetical protein
MIRMKITPFFAYLLLGFQKIRKCKKFRNNRYNQGLSFPRNPRKPINPNKPIQLNFLAISVILVVFVYIFLGEI